MLETWVRSLGWEDPLEKGMNTHSSILTGELHGLFHGLQRVRHDWLTFTLFLSFIHEKKGLHPWLSVKNPLAIQATHKWAWYPGSGRSPEGRHGNPQPTPIFLPGEFHGQRSPEGYSPWGHSDMTWSGWTCTHIHVKMGTSTPCTVNWDDLGGKQRHALRFCLQHVLTLTQQIHIWEFILKEHRVAQRSTQKDIQPSKA